MNADALEGGHLVAVDEMFRQGYSASTRLVVCGESVTSGADGGGELVDLRFCPDCAREVIRRNGCSGGFESRVLLTTQCRRSDGVAQCGPAPERARRCPVCFAAG